MFADMDDIFNTFCAESDEIIARMKARAEELNKTIERMKARAEELDKTIKEDERK